MRKTGKDLLKSPAMCGVISGRLDVAAAKKAKTLGAKILEVRVDTLKEKDPGKIASGIKKIGKAGLPLLLTIRSVKEGGEKKFRDSERLELFKKLMPLIECVDIETTSKTIAGKVVKEAKRLKKKVIVSFHDFKKTPDESGLKKIIKEAKKLGADVVKIAATPKSPKDAGRLFSILLKEKSAIIIAMGEKWRATRVIFPLYGSLLTYGAIGRATAPGQMTLKELSKFFK